MSNMALKLSQHFHLLMEKFLGRYFLDSLPSGGTVQPENTYFCFLKETGQVRESQKIISINTNHSQKEKTGCEAG